MDKLFLFLHIPKTAGTTLHYLLERQFAIKENELLFTIYKQGHTEQAYKKLTSLSREESNRIQVIRGHMPFGWHRLFPWREFSYFTIFRDPIERVISHYYYEYDNPERPFHHLATKMSLEEYIEESGVVEVDNGQTRFIAGASEYPFDEVTYDILEKAKNNLVRYFSVFGFSEKFDEFLILLSHEMNWKKTFFYTPKNVNANRRFRKDLPSNIIQKIENSRHCKLDIELYNFAKKIYTNKINENHGLGIQVNKFKKLNKMFGLIYPSYEQIKLLVNKL